MEISAKIKAEIKRETDLIYEKVSRDLGSGFDVLQFKELE